MTIIMSRVLGIVVWIETVSIHVRRHHEEVWRHERKTEEWLKVIPVIELFSWGEFFTLFILLFLHFFLLLFDWEVVDLLEFNFFLPFLEFLSSCVGSVVLSQALRHFGFIFFLLIDQIVFLDFVHEEINILKQNAQMVDIFLDNFSSFGQFGEIKDSFFDIWINKCLPSN